MPVQKQANSIVDIFGPEFNKIDKNQNRTFDLENTNVKSISTEIFDLRSEEYDVYEKDGRDYFVRDVRKEGGAAIHKNEVQIQALRYLKGMLLIMEGSDKISH